MWKWSPKTPHTQFLCRVQFHKLPLKTHCGSKKRIDGILIEKKTQINFDLETKKGICIILLTNIGYNKRKLATKSMKRTLKKLSLVHAQ